MVVSPLKKSTVYCPAGTALVVDMVNSKSLSVREPIEVPSHVLSSYQDTF